MHCQFKIDGPKPEDQILTCQSLILDVVPAKGDEFFFGEHVYLVTHRAWHLADTQPYQRSCTVYVRLSKRPA